LFYFFVILCCTPKDLLHLGCIKFFSIFHVIVGCFCLWFPANFFIQFRWVNLTSSKITFYIWLLSDVNLQYVVSWTLFTSVLYFCWCENHFFNYFLKIKLHFLHLHQTSTNVKSSLYTFAQVFHRCKIFTFFNNKKSCGFFLKFLKSCIYFKE
jgi:hypothetical protein